jgi:hypothetical protein
MMGNVFDGAMGGMNWSTQGHCWRAIEQDSRCRCDAIYSSSSERNCWGLDGRIWDGCLTVFTFCWSMGSVSQTGYEFRHRRFSMRGWIKQFKNPRRVHYHACLHCDPSIRGNILWNMQSVVVIGYWDFLIENYRQQRDYIVESDRFLSRSSFCRFDKDPMSRCRQGGIDNDKSLLQSRNGSMYTQSRSLSWRRVIQEVRLSVIRYIFTLSKHFSLVNSASLSRLRGNGADRCLLAALFPGVYLRGVGLLLSIHFLFLWLTLLVTHQSRTASSEHLSWSHDCTVTHWRLT